MTKKEEIKKIANELNITQAEVIRRRIIEKRYERLRNKQNKIQDKIEERIKEMYLKHLPNIFEGRKEGNFGMITFERNSKEYQAFVKYSGWLQYSRKTGWYKTIAYIVGKDKESGWYCIQVPGRCYNLAEAQESLKPALVLQAEKEGRVIIRQGDVYFVQTKGKCEIGRLPRGHECQELENGYIITHKEHDTQYLTGKNWKAVQQKSAIGRVRD